MKEKNNKQETAVTGSAAAVSEEKEEVSDDPKKDLGINFKAELEEIESQLENLTKGDNDQVADIMEKILSLDVIEKDLGSMALYPCYILMPEEKSIWLYSVTRRAFFEVKKGSEILSIEDIDGTKSSCLINGDVYEVPNEMITNVGWN